jgi:protein-tyrosine-phosphatase
MTELNRRAILVLALAATTAPRLALASRRKPVVLFICDFGTAKSAIARELFRRRARERGIAVVAFSRGLQIEDHISPPLKRALDAEAIDTRRDGFAVLSVRDVRAANVIVSFAKLPSSLHPTALHDWTSLPSVNDNWPAARADLDRRIEALLDTIAAQKGRGR